MSRTALVAFSVRATQVQAIQWGALAGRLGFDSVGAFLSFLANREADLHGPYLLRWALRWKRAPFRVVLDGEGEPSEDRETVGPTSGAFAIFRGSRDGATPRHRTRFSLVHRPSGRILVTLPRERDCKALASELARLPVSWDAPEPPTASADVRAALHRVLASHPQ